MATTISSALQGKTVYIQESGFGTDALTYGLITSGTSPSADGTAVLTAVVPVDGAELIAATFTVQSVGNGDHTQSWSISDGTNVLATLSSADADATVGTVHEMTMGTAIHGKAIGTTTGARLTLTNTSVGTSTEGMAGRFVLVWAL